MRRLPAASIVLALASCGTPERPTPPERPNPRIDKRALYADAGLIPTREGERIRRELALAGELTAALELLDLGPVHVDVELREPSVSVVARTHDGGDPAVLEARITALALAMIPSAEHEDVHVWLQPESADSAEAPPLPAPTPLRTWALALACLGLGVSIGLSVERLRARHR